MKLLNLAHHSSVTTGFGVGSGVVVTSAVVVEPHVSQDVVLSGAEVLDRMGLLKRDTRANNITMYAILLLEDLLWNICEITKIEVCLNSTSLFKSSVDIVLILQPTNVKECLKSHLR